MAKRKVEAVINLEDKFTGVILKQQKAVRQFYKEVNAIKAAVKVKADIKDVKNALKYTKNLGFLYNPAVKIVAHTELAKEQIMRTYRDLERTVRKPLTMTVGVLNKVGINPTTMAIAGGVAGAGAFHSLRLAGNLEQTQMAMQTLIKDKKGDVTKGFINEMKDFAIATPFEFTDLIKNTRFAMAMGFQHTGIKSLMTDVGDAVAGLGTGSAGLEGVIRALGQIQTKGKVSAQEMNQLAEQGIGAWKYVAKDLGVTEAVAMKMGENGLIPAAKALKAIQEGMRQDFGGLMAKQARTLFGLLSTIKDFANLRIFTSFGEGIRDGILPYLTRFTDGLTSNVQMVGRLQEMLKTAGNSIGSFVGRRIESVYNWFNGLMNDSNFLQLGTADKVIYMLKSILTNVRAYMNGDGGDKVREIVRLTVEIASLALREMVSTIMPFAVSVGISIGKGIIQGLWQGLGDIPVIGGLFQVILGTFLVSKTIGAVLGIVKAIGALKGVFTDLKLLFTANSFIMFGVGIPAILTTLVSLLPIIIAAVAAIGAVYIAITNWENVASIFQFSCESMVAVLKMFGDWIKSIWGGIWSGVVEIIKSRVRGIIEIVNFVIDAINSIQQIKLPKGFAGLGGTVLNIHHVPSFASGNAYIPEDNYPALLHRGERVLTASENRNYTNKSNSINIAKLADTIIIREEADIDKFAGEIVKKLRKYSLGYV